MLWPSALCRSLTVNRKGKKALVVLICSCFTEQMWKMWLMKPVGDTTHVTYLHLHSVAMRWQNSRKGLATEAQCSLLKNNFWPPVNLQLVKMIIEMKYGELLLMTAMILIIKKTTTHISAVKYVSQHYETTVKIPSICYRTNESYVCRQEEAGLVHMGCSQVKALTFPGWFGWVLGVNPNGKVHSRCSKLWLI